MNISYKLYSQGLHLVKCWLGVSQYFGIDSDTDINNSITDIVLILHMKIL